jgi:hypothetical protein
MEGSGRFGTAIDAGAERSTDRRQAPALNQGTDPATKIRECKVISCAS